MLVKRSEIANGAIVAAKQKIKNKGVGVGVEVRDEFRIEVRIEVRVEVRVGPSPPLVFSLRFTN